jgi:protein TonB
MRSALFFVLSVTLHAAALVYPVGFAARNPGETIHVTVLPREPEPGGGYGGEENARSNPRGRSNANAAAFSGSVPRTKPKAPRVSLEPPFVAAVEVETTRENNVALTSAAAAPSQGEEEFVSAVRGGLGGSGDGGSSTGGNGAGTGSGSGFGAALGSGPGGSGSGVIRTEARYRETPRPQYPESARRQGREGRVLLRVLVDHQGRARQIEINRSSGSDVLDRAAAEAMKRWRFYPARDGDTAIESWLRVPIEFRLDDATAR